MDAIHVGISGDHAVGLRFDAFPDSLRGELLREINALANELLARVEAATPSLTGQLRSEERVRIFNDPDHIKGEVDIAGERGSQDFAKAAALEYGAHGPAKVRAHGMRLDHAWAEKLNAPITVMVEAYTRTANILEAAFERGPLAQMAPEAIARLTAVVEKTVAEANA